MMKTSACILLLFCSSLIANAQETEQVEIPEQKNFLTFSPFHMILSTFQPAYERFTNNYKYSFYISPGFILRGKDEGTLFGSNTEAQFRVFVRDRGKTKNPNFYFCSYLAPYIHHKYIHLTTEYEDYYYTQNEPVAIKVEKKTIANLYGTGFVFGFQVAIEKHFVADVYLGGGAQYSDYNGSFQDSFSAALWGMGHTGIIPKLGFKGGFAF